MVVNRSSQIWMHLLMLLIQGVRAGRGPLARLSCALRRGPVVFTYGLSHGWSHGLGEIVTALLDNKMQIIQLVEHDSVPWEALPGQMVVDDAGGCRLSTAPERLAASYTIQAIKL